MAGGHKLHSKGGNLIEVGFPAGYSAGTDRDKGFAQATKGSLSCESWMAGVGAASGSVAPPASGSGR